MMLFQPQIGLKIAKNTTIIKITVGISLIILKNFADRVFVEFFKAARHLPKKSLYADNKITKTILI